MYTLTSLAILHCVVLSVHAFCGTDAGSMEEQISVQEQLQSVSLINAFSSLQFGVANRPTINFTIPTVWNVFYDKDNPLDGNITETTITDSHKLINSFFTSQLGLTFHPQQINRIPIDNRTLHKIDSGTPVEFNLKKVYRVGDAKTLNIYTVGRSSNNSAVGWSTFPWDYVSKPKSDGIFYRYNFLPGTKNLTYNTGYNTGKVLVHEIGHWIGLYHTFQGGCGKYGDFVDDTPPEAEQAKGCPSKTLKTCPDTPGFDPVDNMMDYSNDTCRERFTAGQYERVAAALYHFRNISLFSLEEPVPGKVRTYPIRKEAANASARKNELQIPLIVQGIEY